MKSELTTLLYSHGRWSKADKILIPAESTRLGEIWRFSANVICYGRVALTLAAAVTLMGRLPRTTAALILLATLLDWVDGPVARRLDQSTIFGCGVDWLADVLCQVITLVWWAQLDLRYLPVVFAFTAVEMALSIFDFASSVSGIYPSYRGLLSRVYGNPFFLILDWCWSLGGAYSHLGTFLWLAYPLFSLATCLRLSIPGYAPWLGPVQWALLVPALLYMWCETAYLVFVLRNWWELPRKTAA